MNQARAVLWAQVRSQINSSRRGGRIWSLLMPLVWYGGWGIAAYLANVLMAEPDLASTVPFLPGVFLLIFLYWQVVPLLVAASGASIDLKKIQAYPISTPQLFTLELLLRGTSAVEMLLILTGMGIGMLRNPAIPLWSAAGLVPFVVLNLLVALTFRDLIVRLLAIRRVREIAALLVIALATIPQLMVRRGISSSGGGGPRQRGRGFFRMLVDSNTSEYWPWTATSNLMFSPEGAPAAWFSLLILVGWILLIGGLAAWQFQAMLRFDAQAAGSGGKGDKNGRTLMDRIYALPSMFLPDPVGTMVEKELRYLIRSPRFRMVFLMGCTFGLIFSRAFGSSSGGAGAMYLPDSLVYAGVYSLLLLGEVCFWNVFGFDRSATQLYFLAPVRFRQVLLAKNITALVFVSLEILLAAVLLTVLQKDVAMSSLLQAFVVTGVVCLYLLAAGNIMSVRNPRSANPQASMKTSASGKAQFMLLLLYPVTLMPGVLAYLARWVFGTDLAFYAVLVVMGGIGAVFYWFSLESASDTAGARREQIVMALSAGEGPIAT